MIRPDLRNRPRKTTVVAKRLAFLEEEHAGVTRLWAMMTEDMIDLRDNQPRQDLRIATLTGLVAAIVAVLGAEPGQIGIWLIAMSDDDTVEEAAQLGESLTEQLLLRHGTPMGEG